MTWGTVSAVSATITNIMADTTTTNFRTTPRHSSLRANIFLLECMAVLAAYLYALHHRFGSLLSPHESSLRATILASFGIIYFVRLNLMSRYLLPRELAMEELTFVILIWLPSILSSFVLLATTEYDLSTLQAIGVVIIYMLGSYLNTFSELQRKQWKADPINKGRCYTLGLFSLSRNINYFGDTVLFGAWALATGSVWNVWVPLLMGSTFWWYHIPDKEAYLAKRYGREWVEYKEKVPYAFIPYVC